MASFSTRVEGLCREFLWKTCMLGRGISCLHHSSFNATSNGRVWRVVNSIVHMGNNRWNTGIYTSTACGGHPRYKALCVEWLLLYLSFRVWISYTSYSTYCTLKVPFSFYHVTRLHETLCTSFARGVLCMFVSGYTCLCWAPAIIAYTSPKNSNVVCPSIFPLKRGSSLGIKLWLPTGSSCVFSLE